MFVPSVADSYFRCSCARRCAHYTLSVGLIDKYLHAEQFGLGDPCGEVVALGSFVLEQDLCQWD